MLSVKKGDAMASDSHTGKSGNTCWCTEAAEEAIHKEARTLPPRPGRGADRRVGDAVMKILRNYEQVVSPLPPADRACFAGTLIGYPGAAYHGKRIAVQVAPDEWVTRRVGETKRPGSKRIYLRPDAREFLEQLTPYGLVLEHQHPQTRPAGNAVHPRDASKVTIARTGRPLSDVLLTAVVLHTGRALEDAPVRDIEWQILRQETAQRLWTVGTYGLDTTGQAGRRAVQEALAAALPGLLSGPPARSEVLRRVLPGWRGSLHALKDAVAAEVPDGDYQLALSHEVRAV